MALFEARTPGLRTLDLADSRFNNAELMALAQSPYLGQVTSLGLARTNLGWVGPGVRALLSASRPGLTDVDLSDTQVTDVGLKELASLESLQWLSLGVT